MGTFEIIGLIAVSCIIGIGLGCLIYKIVINKRISSIKEFSQKIIEDAQKEARTLKKETAIQAKDSLYQMKQEFERETKEIKLQATAQEKRLFQKEEHLEKKLEQIEKREIKLGEKEKTLSQQEADLKIKSAEYDDLIKEQVARLESISGFSSEEAKKQLIAHMEEEAKYDAAKLIRQIETETRSTADHKAQEILALAVKRYAGDYVAERTVSVVALPSEEMKGRIIGREGRNIRAIEAATGIDLIVDDTPEAVILSGFNPIRREVARISIERLIEDGRIHPARIEEIVNKVTKEIDLAIKEEGEQAAFDLGVHGMNRELIKLLGRLKYRSSYAQNVLTHSIEVGFLCGVMAAELGVNVKLAKRAGLLHDIGKAIDHEVEGSHSLIGADVAKKYGENPQIVHAIAAHHEEIPPDTILSVLVQAADTLSGARPGARREMLESYVKRLDDLENIATSFQGVNQSYAIQAGREIRIMVDSDKINDDHAHLLCRDIAKKIEKELSYPGQIKVIVIRETRSIEYAK